jgi:hypothetical protein
MPGWFKPLHGVPRAYDVLAFDIEGSGEPDGFACGALVGDVVYSFFTDRVQMFKAILEYADDGYRIFSHNLQYDLPVLEGDDFPSGSLVFSRYNLLWASYRRGRRKVRLYDSQNLFPRYRVSSLGALVGTPKGELPEGLLRRLARGEGWSSFLRPDQELIRKYCARDAQIVYLAVSLLQDVVLSMGGQLAATLAGVSMDIYRRRYHKWPWKSMGPATNQMARGAYYGGRVENFAVGEVEHVNMYDVTSLYPAVQSVVDFPHPNHTRLEMGPGCKAALASWAGVCRATVEVKESFIPPLPYRSASRLFFPFGEITGEWTLLELRRALASGVRLRSIDWVLGSPVTFNPFGEWVHTLFGVRQAYLQEGKPQANLVKLILNSLYGRFGLNPEGGLYELVRMDGDFDFEAHPGYVSHALNGHLFAYTQMPVTRYPDYVNVLFAAQVAAGGRSVLLDQLEAQGEDAIYCDTDSIITRGTIATGDGLGDWRPQMIDGKADLIGPKEYAAFNRYMEAIYHAKGIPERVAKEYFETGAARFFRALPIREAIARGKNPSVWVETYKARRHVVPKRWAAPPWVASRLAYCPTYPYRARQIAGELAGLHPEAEQVELIPALTLLAGYSPSDPQLPLDVQ